MFVCVRCLVPDAQEGVPGAGGDRHAVLGDAETRHAVVVAGQDAWNNIIISLLTPTFYLLLRSLGPPDFK